VPKDGGGFFFDIAGGRIVHVHYLLYLDACATRVLGLQNESVAL